MDEEQLDELIAVLDRWSGSTFAVRVVSGDDLLVVCTGQLGPRSELKLPAHFWPVGDSAIEQPGVYVHAQLLGDVMVHVGGFVLEFTHAVIEVNVRRL